MLCDPTAQALTFSQVCSCVTRGVPPETIRANLETVARVVHGCWVLKRCVGVVCAYSCARAPGAYNVVPLCYSDLCVAGRNVHVRDYILLQIMASPTRSVSRLDVCDATCSRKQDVTAILKGTPAACLPGTMMLPSTVHLAPVNAAAVRRACHRILPAQRCES